MRACHRGDGRPIVPSAEWRLAFHRGAGTLARQEHSRTGVSAPRGGEERRRGRLRHGSPYCHREGRKARGDLVLEGNRARLLRRDAPRNDKEGGDRARLLRCPSGASSAILGKDRRRGRLRHGVGKEFAAGRRLPRQSWCRLHEGRPVGDWPFTVGRVPCPPGTFADRSVRATGWGRTQAGVAAPRGREGRSGLTAWCASANMH